MTKREYAISKGLAQPGRGRLSREAHEAISKAEAEGTVFDDTPVFKAPPRTVDSPKTERPVDSGPKDDVENPFGDAFMRYSFDQMFEYNDDNGKTHKVSCRPACMNCGYSLVGHTCNDPVVLTYHGIRSVQPEGASRDKVNA